MKKSNQLSLSLLKMIAKIERVQCKINILKAIKNAAGVSVVFLINMCEIHFVYVLTRLPFVRERFSINWTRLQASVKNDSEK